MRGDLGLLLMIAALLVLAVAMRASESPHPAHPHARALADGTAVIKASPPGSAVFFDIDDTLLDTARSTPAPAPRKQQGPRDLKRHAAAMLLPNLEILQLARQARDSGMRVVLLTARPSTRLTREWTEANLAMFDVPYHELHFDHKKALFRESWSRANPERPIALTVGDRAEDVRGSTENGYHGILLPGSDSPTYALLRPAAAERRRD